RNPKQVVDVIREEEESFIRTLDRGIKLFQEAAEPAAKSKRISGADAFQLHDTYGLYIDITEQMASEAGLSVDRTGYEEEMRKAKEKARGARKKMVVTAVAGELPKTDDSLKYRGFKAESKIRGWVKDNAVVKQGKLSAGEEGALLLDETNFYAEQGGQVGDAGLITTATGRFEVD